MARAATADILEADTRPLLLAADGTADAALATIMCSPPNVGERGRWFEEPRLPRAQGTGSRCGQGCELARWQAARHPPLHRRRAFGFGRHGRGLRLKVRCGSTTETVATMRDPWCAEPTVHGSNRKALAALKDRGLA